MEGIRTAKIEQVTLDRDGVRQPEGDLYLTPFHLVLQAADLPDYQLAYPLINLATRLPQTFTGLYPLSLRTRTFESLTLLFKTDAQCADAFETIKELTVLASVEKLYAFSYVPDPPLEDRKGWSCYTPREEFARMGVGTRTKAWRLTDINRDYSFSPTYPAKLVVPAKISDAVLAYASKYRSKERVPALTYLHWANFATITRCSQPMVGIKQARSVQDEKLVETIFQTHLFNDSAYSPSSSTVFGATPTNLIVDARPTTNAMANVAKGAGSENMENYKSGKKVYLGIDNIHVMRDSLNRVNDALRESEPVPGSELPPPPLDRQALRRSNWLKHITTLLEGSTIMVRNIHVNASHVLVHCSDGWDRTAQLAAVAEVCLDPFYRTINGFQVLIEKEFVSFGHKFLDRAGHLSSDKFFHSLQSEGAKDGFPAGADAEASQQSQPGAAQAFFASVHKQFSATVASNSHLKETSPVFHQFLDCIYQILEQNPDRFEFNELFLRTLYEQLYTCQFGTFLLNSERDRRMPPEFGPRGSKAPWERTVSAWDWFNLPAERSKFLNPDFDSSLDDRTSRLAGADMGVLFPNPKDVKFWYQLFKRGDEEMNGKPLPPAVEPPTPPAVGGDEEDPVVEQVVEESGDLQNGRPTEEGSILTSEVPYQTRARNSSNVSQTSRPGPSRQLTADDGRPTSAASNDTYRPFTSTSSAFSLKPSPPSDSPSQPASSSSSLPPSRFSFTPSTLNQNARAPSPASASKPPLSPGNGWGASWTSLSTGAMSALSGAAKEVSRAATTISAQAHAAAAARGSSPGWRKEDEQEPIGGGRYGGSSLSISDPLASTSSGSANFAIPRPLSADNPWATSTDVSSSHFTSTSPPRAIPSPRPRTTATESDTVRPSLSSFGPSSVSQQWSFIEPPPSLPPSRPVGQGRAPSSYVRVDVPSTPLGGEQKQWRGLQDLSIEDVRAGGYQFPKREVKSARVGPTPSPVQVVSEKQEETKTSAGFDPLGVGL